MPPRTVCGNRTEAAPIYGNGPGRHSVRNRWILMSRAIAADLGPDRAVFHAFEVYTNS